MSNQREKAASVLVETWINGNCEDVARELLNMARAPLGGPAAIKLAIVIAVALGAEESAKLVRLIEAAQ